MSTIFVAGSYGVGKSTLCENLSRKMAIPFYSAGDIISKVNGETYGANKVVSDKVANQDILSGEINKILKVSPHILLAGHFCIFNKLNQVEYLPAAVFSDLHIETILLLEADSERIVKNLGMRDGKEYATQEIQKLIAAENAYAQEISKKISCPLRVYHMQFNEHDVDTCLGILRKEMPGK